MVEQERYIQILRDSLDKKERILNNLYEMTKQQESYLEATPFEIDVFEEMIDVKATMIDELNSVDDGFEATYERIGAYMREHQEELGAELREMQNRIREITRISLSLQALEERNRARLEIVLGQKQKEVHSFRKGSQVMNNYYQNMAGMANMQRSSMLDQKK